MRGSTRTPGNKSEEEVAFSVQALLGAGAVEAPGGGRPAAVLGPQQVVMDITRRRVQGELLQVDRAVLAGPAPDDPAALARQRVDVTLDPLGQRRVVDRRALPVLDVELDPLRPEAAGGRPT